MKHRLYKELDWLEGPAIRMIPRVVVCAACKYGDVAIICGARHYDQVMLSQIKAFSEESELRMMKRDLIVQGFIDQYGEFMDRQEALAVALNMGQVVRSKLHSQYELFSEDLY